MPILPGTIRTMRKMVVEVSIQVEEGIARQPPGAAKLLDEHTVIRLKYDDF